MAGLDRSPGIDVPRGATPVALFLTANGAAVRGDSRQKATAGAIECTAFQSAVAASLSQGGGHATGRRTHEGISIRKPIDRSSPLLAKALCNNEVIEGTFKFFRPSPKGAAATKEHYFTVEISQGRVARIHLVSPDGGANPGPPPIIAAFEDVQFTYNEITWRYEITGTEHSDTWNVT